MRAVSGSDGGTLQVTRSAARKRAGASKESIHPSDSRGRSLIDIRSPAIQMTKTLAAIPAYNEEVAIGSVALRCQRYVDEAHAAFVVPPAMLGDERLEAAWLGRGRGAQGADGRAVGDPGTRPGWAGDTRGRG